MKKILCLIPLFLSFTLSAQEEKVTVETGDDGTRVKIGRSGNIAVQESEGATRIKLGGTVINVADDNIHIDFGKEYERKSFRGHWAGFEMGINGYAQQNYSNYSQKNFMDLKRIKSTSVRLNFLQFDFSLKNGNKNVGVLTGLGLESKDYRFDNAFSLVNINGKTEPLLLTYDKIRKSKLNIVYLTVPLLFEMQFPQSTGRRFHIGMGVEGGWRISSHTKVKYKEDGSNWKKEKNHNNFNLNDFKLDAQLRFGYSGFHFFVNYGLLKLFKDGKGPELTPITIGMTLLSF